LTRKKLASLATLLLSHSHSSAATRPKARHGNARMETVEDLKELSMKLNPVLGFWDPLNMVGREGALIDTRIVDGRDPVGNKVAFPGKNQEEEARIGFLRHAEIKHGRVAMAGFVGYCLQANGIHFPWKLTGEVSFADIAAAGSPADQWDALPTLAKLQIILFVGFLEAAGENKDALEKSGMKHYMRGGKPGAYPSLRKASYLDEVPLSVINSEKSWSVAPHPIPLDLFDPLKFQKKWSDEKKEKGRLVEINNGRLAMLGLFSLLAESKLPGSVPVLSKLGFDQRYEGEIMAPFTAKDASLPFVEEMLKFKPIG